jgi:adenylate cyclase
MAGLSSIEAASRAGVEPAYVERLLELGCIRPRHDGLSIGDVRRIGLLRTLEEAGLPLDALAAGMQRGIIALDFVDAPEYDRFASLTSETFEQVSARTGIPMPLLGLIRETIASAPARPEDRIRTDELRIVPFVEIQTRLGFDPNAIERLLRVIGDNTRRIAEAEAEWWRSQVSVPRMQHGEVGNVIAAADVSAELNAAAEQAFLAIWNSQQSQTWTGNIIAGFEYLLAQEGLYQPATRHPAICFLDITGYTRLTQEQGDAAAAGLAESLARLVKRVSGAHGGRPVKWLGDGVMFFFPDPARGVRSSLEMVRETSSAGLPPAHVGLHAGPVVQQDGDFFGRTVNLASRVAGRAAAGEVLVTDDIVEVAGEIDGVRFTDAGSAELKNVSRPVRLWRAVPS